MLRVRDGKPTDVTALARIGLAAWSASIGRLVDGGVRERFKSHNPFLAFLRKPDIGLLVACNDDDLIGFAASETGAGEVSDLWILPTFWGLGAGRALLEAVTINASEAGQSHLSLEVMVENARAVAFYKAAGFETDWQRDVSDKSLGVTIAKLGMSKPLTPL